MGTVHGTGADLVWLQGSGLDRGGMARWHQQRDRDLVRYSQVDPLDVDHVSRYVAQRAVRVAQSDLRSSPLDGVTLRWFVRSDDDPIVLFPGNLTGLARIVEAEVFIRADLSLLGLVRAVGHEAHHVARGYANPAAEEQARAYEATFEELVLSSRHWRPA